MQKALLCVHLIAAVIFVSAENDCNLKPTNKGSVCVCNSTYCDTVPKIKELKSGQYQLYTTSKAKLGFYSTSGTFNNAVKSEAVTINVDLDKTFQSMIGFGGAFTDAAGINIGRLSEAAQERLMQAYFGEDGIQYSMGRVPIGGTDFSTKPYTYCDEKDDTLNKFALQEEDYKYKIPYIQKALEIRGKNPFKLFSAAWSAPVWMKTNNWYNGKGTLKDEYWPLWAKYYIKFFEAYKEHNISFWGVSTQNEPANGVIGSEVQNIGFTPQQMNNWVTKYLGPAIRKSPFSDLKIILHDDQRALLPMLYLFVLSNDEVLQYADGIGVHWYTDFFTPANFLNYAKSDKKDLFRLSTEACAGSLSSFHLDKPVRLGSWARADNYLNDIFDDLSYGLGGWIDWNIALNETGGPNWIHNEVDSPIIISESKDEFYKQPMFYALGHFSKFVVPDSIRLNVEYANKRDKSVSSLAFKRPDGKIVVSLRNRANKDATIKVNIMNRKGVITIPAHSINTLLYLP